MVTARIIYRDDGAEAASGRRRKDPCHVVTTFVATRLGVPMRRRPLEKFAGMRRSHIRPQRADARCLMPEMRPQLSAASLARLTRQLVGSPLGASYTRVGGPTERAS